MLCEVDMTCWHVAHETFKWNTSVVCRNVTWQHFISPSTKLTLFALRKCTESEAPVSAADKGSSQSPALEGPGFYQLPSSTSQAERLPTLQGV